MSKTNLVWEGYCSDAHGPTPILDFIPPLLGMSFDTRDLVVTVGSITKKFDYLTYHDFVLPREWIKIYEQREKKR